MGSKSMKAMNLAKLLLWIVVAIQIFHLIAGKCAEELLVVNSSIPLQPSNNVILKHIVLQGPTIKHITYLTSIPNW